MPYVTRDKSGDIIGKFARKQFENQEFLSDTHNDIVFNGPLLAIKISLQQKYLSIMTSVIVSGDNFSLSPLALASNNSHIIAANYGQLTNVSLTLLDNSVKSYSLASGNSILSAISAYILSANINFNKLSAKVASATTIKALNAIDINAGWPN